MTDDALTQAIKEAMRDQGCELVSAFAIYDADCSVHAEGWDEDRDVCPTIGQAVHVGFEAGRRDALTEAADLADAWNAQSDRESEAADRWAGYHAGRRSARMACEGDLRSLLTTEGTKP